MFDWKPEYSVQMQEIDTQHKRLFALASDLHVAMSKGKGKAILDQALGRLIDYTKEHFRAEEQIMRKFGYPGADAHKVEHEQLTAKVVDYQQKLLSGEACLTVDLLMFLQNWLQHHINGSDQKYAAHIRGKAAA